jgi:cyclohexanone monooxygenase
MMTCVSRDLDVIVVGAGFAGLHALHSLRESGYRVVVLEAGDGVGGTWYWNRYPGSRCDVVSIDYSYTFSEELYREWSWSERYAQQPEIERYLNWVADRLDLRRDIRFGTRVVSATYDEADPGWTVGTEIAGGHGERIKAPFLVAATGCLSVPNTPRFDGFENFGGEVYHTATWPAEGVDLTGKRVGVIGTGSSGVQIIPVIAEQADELTVFQRTANFSLPAGQRDNDPDLVRRRKGSLEQWRQAAWKSLAGFDFKPAELTLDDGGRERAYVELDKRWGRGGFPEIILAFDNVFSDLETNEFLAEYFRTKVREIVDDPATAELLCANDHPIGSKRVCADTRYFETYNRDNVRLIDVRSTPIDSFDRTGLVLGDGRQIDLDVVVLATGFDAMTGALRRMGVRGRNGTTIEEAWASGPHTYLGIQVAGFPNLFMITGPQSPSVLNNMILGIEHHVRWITNCLDHMRRHGLRSVEPTPAAQAWWDNETRAAAADTLFPRAESWYVGANIPGKPRVFMVYVGGFNKYVTTCDAIAESGYEGCVFDAPVGEAQDEKLDTGPGGRAPKRAQRAEAASSAGAADPAVPVGEAQDELSSAGAEPTHTASEPNGASSTS